jgi:CheY-like chemotaxis protein/MinD-like ATPase involved in chromosome partitioning or flagellar assembly
MAGNKILIVDTDAASRNFIGAALQKGEYQILQAASGKEGLIFAWRDRPDLIIIDPTLSDLKGEDLAIRLRQDPRTARTPLVALSSDPQPGRARSCTEAGFNEYLVKTAQAVPALVEAVDRLLGNKAATRKDGGLLLVFLSAKGGTGTSSLCANIATNILHYKPEAHAAVVDLVLPIGSIADIVGYQGDQNLVTISEMPANMITPEFFRNNLTEMVNWHFNLLAGSPDPENGNQLKAGAISDIINALKGAFDYVLIDLGRSLSRISLPIIENADLVALIVSTDLSTISLTKTVWHYLQSKGVASSSVYAILNRAVGLEGLTKSEAEKIIGLEIKTSMPYLGSNFALANNQHMPFSQKFPKDTAAIVFKEIAQQMAELARRLRAQ